MLEARKGGGEEGTQESFLCKSGRGAGGGGFEAPQERGSLVGNKARVWKREKSIAARRGSAAILGSRERRGSTSLS